MRRAQIGVLVLALGAGAIAAYLAVRPEPPAVVTQAPAPSIDTIQILVATGDIEAGHRLTSDQVQWQFWPAAAMNDQFISSIAHPTAIQAIGGAIARTAFVSGEPIREAKLIRANGSGYLAALITPGMRAIATPITPQAGVGGFILPNDRVDVILAPDEKTPGETPDPSETILTNVRVLAIDQTVGEKDGQRVVVGKTATLELTPAQAETLTLARKLGTILLALRGIREEVATLPEGHRIDRGDAVSVVRFGQGTRLILR